MRSSSSLRLALAAACALALCGALAGQSSGSSPRPIRATAPRLIAHDVSGFGFSAAKHRSSTKKPAKRSAITAFNDTAITDVSVLNPTSDIGRTQLVTGSNGFFNVYSRTWITSNVFLAHATNADFWSGLAGPDAAGLCATSPQGEPSVNYDWNANRWVISESAYALDGAGKFTGPFVECVAVSSSGDATGTWSRYVFQVSTSLYPDHPALGVWSDGYYVSFNELASDGTWAGAGALALERSKMLTGAAAQARYFDLQGVTPGLGGMLPANISGYNQPAANAPELFLQGHDDRVTTLYDRLELWGFHVDWTAPVTGSTFQPLVNISLNAGGWNYRSMFRCAQPGTTSFWTQCLSSPAAAGPALTLEPLSVVHADAVDALPQLGGRLEWGRSGGGDETLAATETQSMGAGYATPAWFKLSNIGGAGWGINTRGFYDPADSINRFLPSAGFDNSGNVGLAFVKTDAATDLTTAYTNASNVGFGEVDIDAGNAPFTAGATFGGQTMLSLDPIDECTFWFSGPLPQNSGRSISIDNFSFPGCVASAAQVPLLATDSAFAAPLIREGLTISGTAATFGNVVSTSYQWRRCDTSGFNCIDIPGETALTHVMSAADASGTHTLRFETIGTNANGSSVAVSPATTLVQSIPPANVTLPAISGTAQSGQVLSTTDGTWTSSSPVSFTYRWRRCSGGSCANIGGANSATYTLADADVGSTVDVVVSATNTGGGTDANATATVAVSSTPIVSGGGGGGSSGGGGGAGAPDLVVTGSVGNPTPAVGENVAVSFTITDKNLTTAQNLYVTLTLPSGLRYVSSSVDRGSGCAPKSSTSVPCFLDWLSSGWPVGHLQVIVQVMAAGPQTLTATATSAQGVLSASNSTLALSLATPAETTTTSGTPTGLNGTTRKTKDLQKPTSRALASVGARGSTLKLKFRIYDNTGTARALATIKHAGKVMGAAKTGFGPVSFGTTYYLGWHAPRRTAKGSYTFCVTAVDRAGNRSPASCATLLIR